MQLNMGMASKNMSRDEAKVTWKKLEVAIAKIYQQDASDLSFEELYRYSYTMVIHRHGELLYSGMEQSIRTHLWAIMKELEGRRDVAFMKELLVKWEAFHKSTTKVQNILMVRGLARVLSTL
jgi:cullin 3